MPLRAQTEESDPNGRGKREMSGLDSEEVNGREKGTILMLTTCRLLTNADGGDSVGEAVEEERARPAHSGLESVGACNINREQKIPWTERFYPGFSAGCD
jgi:hypothetical protein